MESEIDAVFHDWFAKSRALLPADADEEKSLAHFYKQMRRVRYLPCDLDAALKRASTLPLPDIAGLDTNTLKVAALMRELQGEAGEKPFICPVNVIVRFVPLRFTEQARRIFFVLEESRVIECVDRGAPHMPGKPGKPTVWRYMKTPSLTKTKTCRARFAGVGAVTRLRRRAIRATTATARKRPISMSCELKLKRPRGGGEGDSRSERSTGTRQRAPENFMRKRGVNVTQVAPMHAREPVG